MNKFEYAMPTTIAAAFDTLKADNSVIKAGGIDVLDLLKEGILTPKRLVNLNSIEELKFIKGNQHSGLTLGPNITLDELESEKKLSGAYKALAQAAGAAATPQIRNSATLGGNLCQRPRCWYFRNRNYNCIRKGGNTCFAIQGENENHAIFANSSCAMVHPSSIAVALLALKGKLELSLANSSREVDIADFFVAPEKNPQRENVLKEGEVITEVTLPATSKNFVSFYYKQKAKQSFDWPIAEVAIAMELEQGKCLNPRLILGAAAPIPWRCKEAEAVLNGKTITKDLATKAAEKAVQNAIPLSQNQYKVQVFKAVIKRTICWSVGIDPLS